MALPPDDELEARRRRAIDTLTGKPTTAVGQAAGWGAQGALPQSQSAWAPPDAQAPAPVAATPRKTAGGEIPGAGSVLTANWAGPPEPPQATVAPAAPKPVAPPAAPEAADKSRQIYDPKTGRTIVLDEQGKVVYQSTPGGEQGKGSAWDQAAAASEEGYGKMRAEVRGYADAYFSQMKEYVEQLGAAGVAALAAYQTQLSAAIAQFRSLIDAKPEIPASVKMAMEEMQIAIDKNVGLMREERNRMGALVSGQTPVQEEELREGGLKAQAGVLNAWLDSQHQQAIQAIMGMANLYAQSAGPMAQLQYQATAGPAQAGMELAGQRFTFNKETTEKAFTWAQELRQWAVTGAAEAEKARQQAELEWAKAGETARHNQATEAIAQQAAVQRADYQGWMMANGLTEDEVDDQTNKTTLDILQMKDESELYGYLEDQSVKRGKDWPVDWNRVLDAIKFKFPNATQAILVMSGAQVAK